ncbi:MAG: TerC family protein [Armatimonadota bacterium]|nr:TerC family protein [Armatimonadota bacterium]MDR7387568.1 TerC family protein [Armatimonadota bacterium]MDR7388890.1 TerC family protein [Armatimonadota bacterium]MDR7393501.1 TerC family protein [Armatimonadota bacterium]MDR7396093.1 TerC family protein [Armatimonadota bacterium]
MNVEVLLWIVFHVVVGAMLAVDLGVFQRTPHKLSMREATIWSVVWIAAALLFNAGVWALEGPQVGLEWLTAYLVEKALSVDNLFVFLVIFSYFAVPDHLQPRVLLWGVLGAVVMRASLILVGVTLVKLFHWVLYLFGALLVYTGWKLFRHREETVDPSQNPVLRAVRRRFPVTETYVGGRFFLRREGRLWVTPLFLVLVVVESTDLMFAIDSIPAVLAITHHMFTAYTSNIFAILGLRALFFVLAGIMDMFRYLKYGLSLVLVFIGLKMLAADFYKVPIGLSLAVVAAILAVSVLASVLIPAPKETAQEAPEVSAGS